MRPNAKLGVAVSPAPTFPAVLDACCGGRMFWWNKENPDALFMDCREVEKGAFQNGWNPGWCVKPDEIADFRDMPFPDGVFKMVVFDPPHLTSGSMKSVINKKYGLLNKETWKADIVAGFSECWRVLAPGGVLIFKWNEANIKAKDLLRCFPAEPLFGDFTGKTGSTIWVTYLKTPNAGIHRAAEGRPAGVPCSALLNRRKDMDHFGIGAAIRGAANIYCHSARQTGRTTSLVESVKDGDRIVFSDGREAERVRRLCMDRGVKVDCLVINPRTPERVFESGTPEGRTIFDHSWVEQYYMQAIDRAAQDIDHLERQASGLQINLDYV